MVTPLILDVDLDYFGKKQDIIEWATIAEQYIKAASIITIAREPSYVKAHKTDLSFSSQQAEEEILKSIESVLCNN